MNANQTKAVRPETALPKMLFLDHEAFPNEGYFWHGKREVDIIKVTKPKIIASTAWNWLGEDDIHAAALPMFRGYRKDPRNNKALIKKVISLYEKADIIVGHNIDGYDDRMTNTEIARNDLSAMLPPPHKTIDTLKIARTKFRFNGNTLQELGEFLGLGVKVAHEGFPLWEKCMAGDPDAWKRFVAYNIGDVVLLKKIYFKFRPWITNHPNMNGTENAERKNCPQCGAHRSRMIRRGYFFTVTGRVLRFQCKDCGKWARGAIIRREWKFK